MSIARRFPTPRQQRAEEIGPDELLTRLEWAFRDKPRALRAIRDQNRMYCASLLARLERTYRNGRAT